MDEKRKDKIQRLLALANDANDEESMTALAKAQELMLAYGIDEEEVFHYQQHQRQEKVIDKVIYKGRPHKWVYRLAGIIAKNFRVKNYYQSSSDIELHYVGLTTDAEIAEITFLYAKGSVAFCSKEFMKQPEIKRKYKRKWQLKQDYIEGYLTALSSVFEAQVLTNGYELALQLPVAVHEEVSKLGLVKGKDTSHQVENFDAFQSGYQEGLQFKSKELIN
ncbi:DUF2786 domain-containing protein [Enterococcus faecalis]|uniref:DUF2786 domain-containing protein n=1 Tax=Enterococcus faecalis TaxID=1351 RepID=UPI00032F20EE|nr:DUF2786 domain-containing protein [Enterococcus faecalis]EGO2513370.1 DUF2786 domain-containing protein [Enterococcus faecalis]EHS7986263.1 DUF2786 domain-containing protein [Enterococcus faecalis]EHU9656314.1 DUF2786 domain-containing protein [Enterococcus faecalis]EJM6036048.1 DUF2786 domain-containing protein [Enterococcus faecalis]EJY9663055.1 DUF2786 domain-containing protein [Enterococcus faecalis]